ncbi:hypothetical protein [Nannocystis bainbridge]|uniref:PEGA domain-containing protein n=1 Tax=Nannocystis bainbridge TaxID=2995303 RepID=A0ABT5DQC8_9BACT|nr:hypothetical protein [Nannocystis bainbridge]MDC0715855.1 hypothetical protein [Nannocystis bainbridge]
MVSTRARAGVVARGWSAGIALALTVTGVPLRAGATEPVPPPEVAAPPLPVYRPKVVLDLRFWPERAARGAELRLRPIDHDSSSAQARPLTGPTTTVTLRSGVWQLQVRGRRHGADLYLTVQPGQPPVDVELTRRGPVDDPRLQRDRKLMFGVFGGFVATYVAGLGLLVAANGREKRASRRDAAAYEAAGVEPDTGAEIDPAAAAALEAAYPAARLRRDLADAGALNTAGAVLGGASIGALVSLLPIAARARRRAAVLELGLGGALLAGCGGWLGTALGERGRLLDAPRPSPTRLDDRDGSRIAAALLTGIGAGLVLFSAITLAHDAADRRRRARAFATAPWAAPGLAGWALAGRF